MTIRNRMPRVGWLFFAAAIFAGAAFAQASVAELRARFAAERDPVKKAKIMPKLGDAEFQEIGADFAGGKFQEALGVLREYRDEAQSCALTLDATNINPEKHSSGFKELQISSRESLRRLDELLSHVTPDEQAPFQDMRKSLVDLNRHLFQELFPDQPPAEGAGAEKQGH